MEYTDVGCSQEDHIVNCSHFGQAGTYLSRHSDECENGSMNGGRKGPCICNPKARGQYNLDFWRKLNATDARVLLAGLWAAKDVHSVVDNLTDEEWERLEYLADKLNHYKFDPTYNS